MVDLLGLGFRGPDVKVGGGKGLGGSGESGGDG